MKDWNVVVTSAEDGWKQAHAFLSQFGTVGRSDFYNVILLRVDDVDEFLPRFSEALGEEAASTKGISHVFPARSIFAFAMPEDFETKARARVLELAPQLAHKTFHVRMHRRGFKGRISSRQEERLLDDAILESLAAAGTPARIAFDDPDVVIDVETVEDRAGTSLWTRNELIRYPFLGID